jgi:2-phosphosulfolactate phosphatase
VQNFEQPTVHVRSTLADVTPIEGTAIVIDTFRAFTTAAYAFAQGVEAIYLADSVSSAAELATTHGYLTMGEADGRKPEAFDLSNSPWEITQRDDLDGVTLVHRSSAGTRGALHVLSLGAAPVYVASLVVATTTARLVRHSKAVTVVACGLYGTEPADEDEATAWFVADHIMGDPNDGTEVVESIRVGRGAQRLRSAAWAPSEDLSLCLAIDRFDFVMRISEDARGVRVDCLR